MDNANAKPEADRYAVVEFVSEIVDDQPVVQEVPVNWLVDGNTMCWWPPKNALKEIKAATEPDRNGWKKCPIRVRKLYSDLFEARQKCILPSDESDVEQMGKFMRKKKETYKQAFRDTSQSPPPQPPASDVGRNRNNNGPFNFNQDIFESSSVSTNLANWRSDGSETRQQNVVQQNTHFDINEIPSSSPSPVYWVNSENMQSNLNTQKDEINSKLNKDEINMKLDRLSDEMILMKKKVDEAVQGIGNIGLLLTNVEELLRIKQKSTDNNKKFSNIFPLKNELELKNFATLLASEPGTEEELTSYLKSIGGSGPKDHHGRMFRNIFTNSLGLKCSWKGQRGNIKIENINFIQTCMSVLRQVWKSTDKEFELYSQDWLRHCAQRKKREEAREVIPLNQE